MRPHTLDEMSTIILIFCRDGANKIELIEKCYLNDIESHFPRPHWPNPQHTQRNQNPHNAYAALCPHR